jgi:hypothetical protein
VAAERDRARVLRGLPAVRGSPARTRTSASSLRNPDYKRFYEATPFLPFSRPAGVVAACASSRSRSRFGIGLAVLVRWFHPTLFGA